MDTRTALLDTAETLARSRGFDAFSYADLSRAVGIQKASIHHHFAAKSDLAAALIARYRDGFFATLGQIADNSDTAADCLRAYVSLYRTALHDGDRLCLCIAFSASRDSFDARVLDDLRRFHDDSIAWLTAVFDRAATDHSVTAPGDPAVEAAACLALVEGAQIIGRAAAGLAPFDAATGALLNRLHP